jgi:hypothetical protein
MRRKPLLIVGVTVAAVVIAIPVLFIVLSIVGGLIVVSTSLHAR